MHVPSPIQVAGRRRRLHQPPTRRIPKCPGPCWTAAGPDRPYPGASDAAGGVDARRWLILSSNPAMSAASTPPPSATIQSSAVARLRRGGRARGNDLVDAGDRHGVLADARKRARRAGRKPD